MNAEQEFWDWFVGHEAELFDLDPRQGDQREKIFDELAAQLSKVHRELSFELGPNSARREFVISGSGIRDAFPSVTSLVAAAPTLPRWNLQLFVPGDPLSMSWNIKAGASIRKTFSSLYSATEKCPAFVFSLQVTRKATRQ